jgi:Fe-S cluster biogenesis protein NfuA
MLAKKNVEESLEKIRPYLKVDGGDVQLVRITDDHIVEVKLLGSCLGCPMSLMTLRAGIERALMIEHEEIRRVEQVR